MDTVQDRGIVDVVGRLERDMIALKLMFVLVIVIAFALVLITSPRTDSSPQHIPPATTIQDPTD